MMFPVWTMKPLTAVMLLGAVVTAGEDVRQLRSEVVEQTKLADGRVLTVEKLGRPLPGKRSEVEFVSTLPDGEKIAWAVSRATLEHFLLGYSEKNGLYKLDLTEYFGPHSYKPTIAFHGDSIYLLAGNRGPALIRYHIPTRQKKLIQRYLERYYYLGFSVDSKGRIYWGTYPKTEVIGIDPATDQPFSLGRMTDSPGQTYAHLPAIDDMDVLYVPVGMKRPELYAIDLKTGQKKQILKPAEIKAMLAKSQAMIRVIYLDGKVYADLAGKTMRCTPDGLIAEKPKTRFFRNEFFRNGRQPSRDFGNGETAVAFDEHGLILSKDGKLRTIPIAGLPVVGHELYALGGVRDNILWGSGIFPANTFGVDLASMKSRNYGMVSRGGVQNYDLGAAPQGILLASYTGGFFDLLNPDQPIKKGENPRLLGDLRGVQQERPFRLTPGKEAGVFYTGTMPVKNHLGGAIVRIDTNSGNMQVWKNVIPDQSVMEVLPLNDDSGLLFGLSNVSGGTGARATAKVAEIFLFDPASGKVVWSDRPVPDADLYQGATRAQDGKILFLARGEKRKYYWCSWDPVTRRLVNQAPLEAGRSDLWGYSARERSANGHQYFIVQGMLYEYIPGERAPQKISAHPSLLGAGYITLAPDGWLYYIDECRLMRSRATKQQ